MPPFGLLLIVIPITFTIYHLLPSLACQLNRKLVLASLKSIKAPKKSSTGLHAAKLLPLHWRQKMEVWLNKAGYFSPQAVMVYFILMVIPIPLISWLGWMIGCEGGQPALLAILLVTAINSRISAQIKMRQKSFGKALFKIYRFLDLQLTSGVKVTDSLRGLSGSVQDPIVKPVLIRFSALFELTLDLDQSFKEIRLAFPGPDSELLATHLRQCLQTGQAGRSLDRMEELLFARYFNMMQAETQKMKSQLLVTSMLGILPGIALFLYPLLFEAFQAIHSVFG